MQAILLAGGYGTRLRPLTYTRPKPLLPVAGRPMMEWMLDRLPEAVDRVIVAVNWQAEALEAYFAERPGDLECHVVRENAPLGTAGAVKNCSRHLGDGPFFVLNGDIISDMDLDAMMRQHEDTEALGTISLKEVPEEDVVHFGVIDPDPEDPRRIRGFVEKPRDPSLAPSRLINAGAYLLDASVLDRIPAGRLVSMEKEIFPQLFGRFYGVPFEGMWIDVGDPARMRQATMALDPDAAWGRGTQVDASASVTGSVLGAACRIGAGAVLKDCVMGDRVSVDEGVRLVDCVVGDEEHVSDDATAARIWTGAVPSGYPQKQVGNAL